MKYLNSKKLTLLLTSFAIIGYVNAQDTLKTDTTKFWAAGGMTSITFSQLSFNNWAAGGDNSMTGLLSLNLFGNYSKNKLDWKNTLDLNIGFLKQGSDQAKKSDDRFEVASKLGYKASKHWFYSALLSFKTQFLDGFDPAFADSSVLISSFMAPAYIQLSIGMDYQPNKYFSMMLSPLSARITLDLNDTLASRGMFGIKPGNKALFEVGSYARFVYKKELFKNVLVSSKLSLFSSYTDHPENIDVDWENNINLVVNKFLTTNFILHLLYDNNVIKRVQVKEVFGVGITYKF